MMQTIKACQAGTTPEALAGFLAALEKYGCNMHSVLMARGDGIFLEKYWEPYRADIPHRVYSVTKSFVSVAIGCLADEGKIDLQDPIIKYFPDKLPAEVSPLLRAQTIHNMLTMSTCFTSSNWFKPEVYDRTAFYFAQTPIKPAGTLWEYDSTGSYILGMVVERVSGMPLMAYLRTKVLDALGGFEDAEMLKTPDGTPWGDSALICRPRALMNFARFVMNGGVWEGKRLLSEAYLKKATSRVVDNNHEGRVDWNRWGYGYQFWRTEKNGYACVGMGGQYAIMLPDYDLIFVCTADTQLSESIVAQNIFRTVMDFAAHLDGAKEPASPLSLLEGSGALSVAMGEKASDFAEKINGAEFICQPNSMKLRSFALHFTEDGGKLVYENGTGKKELPFGMKANVIGPFPEAGYSNEYGNVHEINDFRLRCAVSAGWIEEQKLQLRVQIIDRYFGKLMITLGFRDENTAGVMMQSCAEDFLWDYEGVAIAERK